MTDSQPTATAKAEASMLLLSLFPGIGLLDRAFEELGFTVVRGPDLLWGGDVRRFHVPPGVFRGVIGGPPCQLISGANYNRDICEGMKLVKQFLRVVAEADPEFCLMENVPGVPSVGTDRFRFQRFNLSAAECGIPQNRLRIFQFGTKSGRPLVVRRGDKIPDDQLQPCCLASEGHSTMRRSFADFCELQGLPRNFDLPGFTRSEKYRAVGNGVPLAMGSLVAQSILHWLQFPADWWNVCACGCGREVKGRATLATAACRKREQRKRDATSPGTAPAVTASHLAKLVSKM